MIRIGFLVFLLSEGTLAALGAVENLPYPVPEPINCVRNLVGIDELPLSVPDNIQIHVWKQIGINIEYYLLKDVNETQLREIFISPHHIPIILFFHDFGNHGLQDWILDAKTYFVYYWEMGTAVISFEYQKFVETKPQAIKNIAVIANQVSAFLNLTATMFPYLFAIRYVAGHGIGALIATKAMELTRPGDENYIPDIFIVLDFEIIEEDPLEKFVCKTYQLPRIEECRARLTFLLHTSTCSPYFPLIQTCNRTSNARIGHRDYFANGGFYQPGCAENDTVCNRKRAVELYQDSISAHFEEREKFDTLLCENYEEFSNGSCAYYDRYYLMDFFYEFDWRSGKGKFFFTTTSSSPY